MRKLSVRTDQTNEYSTRVQRRILNLDHPQNLLEVLRARLAIAQGLTGNAITTGPNQYRFTLTFCNGEVESTANNVFLLLPHNAPFNSETKQMKSIIDAKYEKSNL